MSALNFSLHTDDVRFLKKHFQVYDPVTQGTHQDFSVLSGSKVILLGERHYDSYLLKIQNEFFKRFLSNNDALLLEGYPVGWTVKKESCPAWDSIPPYTSIKGADVRHSEEVGQQLEVFRKADANLIISRGQTYKKSKQVYKTAVGLINQKLREGKAHIAANSLLLTMEDYTALNEILNTLQTIQQEHRRLLDQVPPFPNPSTKLEVQKSNQVLAHCIINSAAVPSVNKIVSIWGRLHFVGKKEIYEILKKANLKVTVLLPTARDFHKQNKSPKLQFTYRFIRGGNAHSICTLYASVAKLCDPALRNILTHTKKAKVKIWADPTWLQAHEKILIQARTKLCIPIKYPADGYEDDSNIEKVFDRLEPTYLAAQRRIMTNLSEAWIKAKYSPEKNTDYVQLSITERTELDITPKIITSLMAIWEYLCSIRAREYRIPANVPLILTGYSGCEAQNVSSVFLRALSDIYPDGRLFYLDGHLVEISTTTVDNDKDKAIQVLGNKGFTLVLDNPNAIDNSSRCA